MANKYSFLRRIISLSGCQEHAAAAGVGQESKKRLVAQELPLIQGPAVPASCLELTDVSVPQDAPWCGLDIAHAACETRVPLQVSSDCERYQLFLYTDSSGARGLGTRVALKEGAEVATCPGAIFTSLSKATSFLRSPGNGFMSSSVVKIPGVAVHGEPTNLFVVLTGAARFCADYVGQRRFPNVSFHFDASAGASPQMLRLKVSTPSGCGVAAGQPLLLAYGQEYDHEWKNPEPEQKRFKGALDALFAQAAEAAQQSSPAKRETKETSTPVSPPVGKETAQKVVAETTPQQKIGSAKGGTTSPASEIKAPAPQAVPVEANAQGAEAQAGLNKAHLSLVKIADPPCEISLQDSDPPTLHVTSTCGVNKRLAKWTLLKAYKEPSTFLTHFLITHSKNIYVWITHF